MKLQTTIKTLCAAVALATSAAAYAVPFYLDIGTDYGGPGVKANGGTTTGAIDEINYRYTSFTTITDANASGVYDAGDTVLGTGGLLKVAGQFSSGFDENYITSFTPQRASNFTPADPAGNGFGSDWQMALGWNNLVGTVNALGGITYSSGTIHVYFRDAANPLGINVIDFNVTSGGNNAIGQSLDLTGTLSVVQGTGFENMFNFMDGTSFNDVLADSIHFASNQNTSPFYINGSSTQATTIDPNTFYGSGRTGTLEGIHDGSVTIPEPASIALVGLSLLGLGAIRRRKI